MTAGRICVLPAIANEEQITPISEVIDDPKALVALKVTKVSPRRIPDLFGDDVIKDTDALTITRPFTERRRGVEMKLAVQGHARLDETLLRNIALANTWYGQIKQGMSFTEIAAAAQTSKRRVQHLIPFALLAPDIVRRVTLGTQPTGLTSDWLIHHSLPMGRDAQQERIASL